MRMGLWLGLALATFACGEAGGGVDQGFDAATSRDQGPNGAEPDIGMPDQGAEDLGERDMGPVAEGDPELTLMTGLERDGKFREVRPGDVLSWTCPMFGQDNSIEGHIEGGFELAASVSETLDAEARDQIIHLYELEDETGTIIARPIQEWQGNLRERDGKLWFDFARIVLNEGDSGSTETSLFVGERVTYRVSLALPDDRKYTRQAQIEIGDFERVCE